MHSLIDLCLHVVVKNLYLIATINALPDELLQKLLVLCRKDKELAKCTCDLFRNTTMPKLDLHHQTAITKWLDITRGDIQNYLQHLDLTGVEGATDAVIEGLGNLQQLTYLSLSGCKLITGTCLKALHQLPLQRILLTGCTGLNMELTLNALSCFPSLQSLDIANCGLTDTNITAIEKLVNIVYLDISQNNQLTGAALVPVCKLKLLRELLMAHCPLVMSGLKHLVALPNLICLSLSYCEVGDADVCWVETLTCLESLTLIGAQITDKGVESFGKLGRLSDLDLSCTNISDSSIPTFRKLSLKNLNVNFCVNMTYGGVTTLRTFIDTVSATGCSPVQGRPVLLVEDNLLQAKVITRLLKRHNFDVEVVTNGQMALDMYRANPNYEIVVMDIMMPIMDGLTSTSRIRQHEREFGLKRTPIIMQTVDAGKSSLSIEAGCDDFIIKPLDRRLIDKANRLIESNNEWR